MFNRALKHVALAVALLLPTLAAFAAAPAAQAGTGTATAFPSSSYPYALGESSLVENHVGETGCGIGTPNTYTRYYTAFVATSISPYSFSDAEAIRTGFPLYHYAPGDSVTVTFATNWLDDLACYGSEATQAILTLRDMNGTAIGSSVTFGTADPLNNWKSNIYTATLHFDSTGFGAGGGAEKIGQFYVGIQLVGNSEDGADTEGHAPTVSVSGTVDNSYTRGVFTTGNMLGVADKRSKAAGFDADEASATVGKDYSSVRLYSSCWDLPGDHLSSTTAKTYAADHRMIVWSLKPKNVKNCGPNSTSSTLGNGFAYETGQSGWKTVADGAMDSHTVSVGGTNVDYGLTHILQQLEDLGATYNVPVGFAISHEPHDQASDSGHTKCTGVGDSGCGGTAAEYRGMYAHVHSLMSGGYFNNYPHVRLLYIAVDTNMTEKIGSQAPSCTSTSPIGCADVMRPADTDYDLFGADLYNYYRFSGTGATYKEATDAGKLGDATHGAVGLAALHGKHLLLPELGTHPGCPGGGTGAVGTGAGCQTGNSSDTKDGWFRTLATKWTSDSSYEQWLEGFIYFNESPTDSSGAVYDWEYTNKSNSLNNDLSCPTPSGSNNCWDGDNNTATGYHDSFVTDSTYNNSHSAWFVGSSGTPVTFMP